MSVNSEEPRMSTPVRTDELQVGERVRLTNDPTRTGTIVRAQVAWRGQRHYLVTVAWDSPLPGQTRVDAFKCERV
jgi:hypothetical protein